MSLPNRKHHVVLSKYAIPSRFDFPNSKKQPKTLFLAIWIIQKGIFLIFEWSSMSDTWSKSCTPLSSIKICNIEMIRCYKLKKTAENHTDHSKRLRRVYASHGKIFLKWTGFFPDLRFSPKHCKYFVLNYFGVSGKSECVILNNIRSKSKKGHFWHVFVIIEWSGFFLEKPPCTFLSLIVRNIHAKKLRNPNVSSL